MSLNFNPALSADAFSGSSDLIPPHLDDLALPPPFLWEGKHHKPASFELNSMPQLYVWGIGRNLPLNRNFLFFPSTPSSWLEGILDNHQKGAKHPIFYIINELSVDQLPQY